LRIRTAVLCSTAVVATWFAAGAASALEVGPVSVPVRVPPAVTVTLPAAVTVGPVSVPVSKVAPGFGATVNVSPKTGVGASVSLPSAIGSVPLLPGAPHTVQVGLGPGGATVALPGVNSSAPGLAATPSAKNRTTALRSGATHADARPRVVVSNATNAATSARPRAQGSSDSPLVVETSPGAVNASLRRQSSGGVWSLLHDLASAHGLWIVLLLIVVVARFAAGGLLHDAIKRRLRLSST